jgi:hypothetical protein
MALSSGAISFGSDDVAPARSLGLTSLGLGSELAALGDHIAYFWESEREFDATASYLATGRRSVRRGCSSAPTPRTLPDYLKLVRRRVDVDKTRTRAWRCVRRVFVCTAQDDGIACSSVSDRGKHGIATARLGDGVNASFETLLVLQRSLKSTDLPLDTPSELGRNSVSMCRHFLKRCHLCTCVSCSPAPYAADARGPPLNHLRSSQESRTGSYWRTKVRSVSSCRSFDSLRIRSRGIAIP